MKWCECVYWGTACVCLCKLWGNAMNQFMFVGSRMCRFTRNTPNRLTFEFVGSVIGFWQTFSLSQLSICWYQNKSTQILQFDKNEFCLGDSMRSQWKKDATRTHMDTYATRFNHIMLIFNRFAFVFCFFVCFSNEIRVCYCLTQFIWCMCAHSSQRI